MNDLEKLAWEIYCEHTAGCMSAKDYWHELKDDEKHTYLHRALFKRNEGALQYLSRKSDED